MVKVGLAGFIFFANKLYALGNGNCATGFFRVSDDSVCGFCASFGTTWAVTGGLLETLVWLFWKLLLMMKVGL